MSGAALLTPSVPLDVNQGADTVSTNILRLVFRMRRVVSESDPCHQRPCATCFALHRSKVRAHVENDQPVHFVILGFPAKSPNPRKVLGSLPDLAEKLALEFMQSFCDQVSHFHRPGARITICSDGHVFSDLVGVADADVSRYRRELEGAIGDMGGGSLELFGLDDVLEGRSFDQARRDLEHRYAMSPEEIRNRVASDGNWQSLFNGIHRFLFEDQVALRPGAARNQVRKQCKDLAYQVIRRSDAWSRLVAERFPGALRLSIHPQACHSEKIGFHLVRTRDNWLTPWHGVVLDDGERLVLVKRSEAEQLNASLVWRNDRPSHFVAPRVDDPHDAVVRRIVLEEVR